MSSFIKKAISKIRSYFFVPINSLKLKNYFRKNHNKNTVVILSNDSTNSGAPLLALHIAKSLRKRGYQVVIVPLKKGELSKEYENNSDLVLYYPSIPFLHMFRKYSCTIILNTILAARFAKYVKSNTNKIVSLIHELSEAINGPLGLGETQVKNAINYSDFIIFPSHTHLSNFKHAYAINDSKILIKPQGLYKSINNAITKEEAKDYVCKKYGIPSDSYIYLSCGSITSRKGFDFFYELASKYNYSKRIHFVWAGDDTSGFISQIKEYRQLDNVTITGFISEDDVMSKLYLSSELFMLLSRRDTFPSVVLEAFALGRPVAAFDKCGGYVEIINKKTGFLVDPFDLNQYHQIIDSFDNRHKEYDAMSKECQKIIKLNFDFEKYIDYLLSL